MFALLIALGALAVGKIHGQDTVASFVINSQISSAPVNRRPAVFQEISQELQPPPLPQQPSFQDRNRNSYSLPSQPAIRENTPRTNIVVTSLPDKMELPSNKTNDTRRVVTYTSALRNNTRQKDLVENRSSPKQVQPVRPNETGDNAVLPEKPTVVVPTLTTNVTLDERANFDGDQCPTGYVRVSGKCVEED